MADPDRYGYKRIEAYRLAHDLAVRIDAMTKRLPGFELFEEGQQIRRSSKSVPSQIAEGYGLRQYKAKFLLYLNQALGSSGETLEHLELLFECGSLKDLLLFESLKAACEKVSAKLGAYIKGVARNHSMPFYLREALAQEGQAAKPCPKCGHVTSSPVSKKAPKAKPDRASVPAIENRESKIENRHARIENRESRINDGPLK